MRRLRARRVQIQLQLDSLDCGPCCIGMIATYYRRTYDRHYLRQLCELDRHGTALGAMARAAEHLGFRAVAARVGMKKLSQVVLPCIAYLPGGHYCVIACVTKASVSVADPAVGSLVYSHEEFGRVWGGEARIGVLLLLEPTSSLRRSDAKRSAGYSFIFNPLLRAFRNNWAAIGVGTVLLLAAQAALPFLSAALVDAGIGDANVSLLLAILVGQTVLIVARSGVEVLQGSVLAFLGAQIHTTLVAQFLRKIARLPFSFFATKRIGDTLQRIEDHRTIQELLTEGMGQAVFVTASFAVFAIVLAVFSPWLFMVYMVGSAVYLTYSLLFLRSMRRLSYKEFSLMVTRQAALLQFISGIEEIKVNNAADYFRSQWERAQTEVARIQVKLRLRSLMQQTGGNLINEIKNIVLVVLAASQVVHHDISLGTMVAVQFVIGQLNGPLTQAIMLVARAGNASTSFERAREVHLLDDEDGALSGSFTDTNDASIRLSHVSFKYGGSGQQGFVLKDLSLTIPAGGMTAIVGSSGSGKSTLMRLLLRMHDVDSGSIMIGSTSLGTLPAHVWREKCGSVSQSGIIFADTLLRNVTLGAGSVDMSRVREACQIAAISDFIDGLPLGYETRVAGDGAGLSRGQVQRILIARALYRNPKYIFLDEATSALDAETEFKVATALVGALEGRTAVVIAHRLSTVRRAHKIVVLDAGRVVEEGNHDALVQTKGYYYRLVRHQLEADRIGANFAVKA